MNLKCARCNRKLKRLPAGQIGSMVFGAKCWKLIDNSQKTNKAGNSIFRDDKTMDMFK